MPTIKIIKNQKLIQISLHPINILIGCRLNRCILNSAIDALRKEIKVRTPYEALEYWYNLKPDLFIREPLCV